MSPSHWVLQLLPGVRQAVSQSRNESRVRPLLFCLRHKQNKLYLFFSFLFPGGPDSAVRQQSLIPYPFMLKIVFCRARPIAQLGRLALHVEPWVPSLTPHKMEHVDTFWKWRQEDHKVKVIFSYIARSRPAVASIVISLSLSLLYIIFKKKL